MGTSQFARATAVRPHPDGGGRFLAELGPEWNCPVVPQGGMVVAVAARAMEAALDQSDHPLRSLSIVFARQVQHGPIEVDVDVLRRGRSMSQCRAVVHNPGADVGSAAVAVFGGPRRGYAFTDIEPPAVPDIDECETFDEIVPPEGFDDGEQWPFWTNVLGAPALGHAPWETWETAATGTSVCAGWFRWNDPARLDDGRWDPLAVVALCDTMPSSVAEKLGPGHDDWFGPSADFTVHVLDDARSEWILGVNRARHASDGYASVSKEMWDMHSADAPVLVAYATQVMFFTTLNL